MRKKYDVLVARRADAMLISHTEFLAQLSSKAARRLLAEFRKATGLIEDNPLQFPYAYEFDVPGIPPETYRKCIFYKRYKALFIVEGNNAYIDLIVDCRQENKNLF